MSSKVSSIKINWNDVAKRQAARKAKINAALKKSMPKPKVLSPKRKPKEKTPNKLNYTPVAMPIIPNTFAAKLKAMFKEAKKKKKTVKVSPGSAKSNISSRRSSPGSAKSNISSRRSSPGSAKSNASSRRSSPGSAKSNASSRQSSPGSAKSNVSSRRSSPGSAKSKY